jgi:hypothetical protein
MGVRFNSTSSLTGRCQIVFLTVWASLAIGAGSVVTSFHQPFQLPSESIASLAPIQGDRAWRMIHVLSTACGCSRRVAEHIIKRGPLPGVREQVLLLNNHYDDVFAERIAARGLHVKTVSEDVLAQHNLRAVPLFVLVSPDGQTHYVGGYGRTYDRDTDIWQQASRGVKPRPLTVYGCAVSRSIQRQIDPFQWKYASRSSVE